MAHSFIDGCSRFYCGGGQRPSASRTLAGPAGLGSNEGNLLANLKGSVGLGGRNYPVDVAIVQRLLNYNLRPPLQPLLIDDCAGDFLNTLWAIKHFQQTVVGMKTPDGRVDPGGQTIRKLQENLKPQGQDSNSKAAGDLCFPMRKQPTQSYKTGMRKFGSNRSDGTRKHAGCDLYAPVGTEILALKDGTVIRDVY